MPFNSLKTKGGNPRLVLVGSFGAGNVGDELILAGFLKQLKNRVPRAEVTVLSGNIRESKRWYRELKLKNKNLKLSFAPMLPVGISSLLSFNWFRTIREIRQVDAVVFPGGGLFTDEESFRAVLIWSLHLLIAQFFWQPVYLFGQSVGPFRTMIGRWLASFALRRVELVVARDVASMQELKKLKVNSQKIQLGEDSALWLHQQTVLSPTPTKRKGSVLRHDRRNKEDIRNVLLSAREYKRLPKNFWQDFKFKLAKYPKASFTFVEFGRGDRAAWERLGKPGKIVKIPTGVEEVLKFVKKYDLVIGMRLHSLIVARLAGVPSEAVSYSRKVKEWVKKFDDK